MNLTAGQQQALDTIALMQKEHPGGGAVCVVSGVAGTGKTSLLRFLGEIYGGLTIVTPTGRAAVRVKEATGIAARTIARWQYNVSEDPDTGKLRFELRELGQVEIPASGFLVVDEASMVGYDTFRNAYNFCKALDLNMVLVGDGFQLPPVEMREDRKGFSVFAPDFPATYKVQLTEILRQSLDSPIIRASIAVREGRWVQEALGDLPQIPASKLTEVATRVWQDDGITVCHRNSTRHAINADVRQALGYPKETLIKGEPLMVTQNNYSLDVFNGEIFPVKADPVPLNTQSLAVRDRHTDSSTYINIFTSKIDTPMEGLKPVALVDREVYGTLGLVGASPVRYVVRDYLNFKFDPDDREKPVYLNANFGYAMTVHKAQGSEAPEVLVVIEPSIRLGTEEGRRHCYTALTRAKKSVTVCWT